MWSDCILSHTVVVLAMVRCSPGSRCSPASDTMFVLIWNKTVGVPVGGQLDKMPTAERLDRRNGPRYLIGAIENLPASHGVTEMV
uniref:Putative secreted peptide n=1 Tax=Anopheles braziliensis TaxID=58242 RepID=A0A2M3ZWC6_9DIPT